MNELAASLVPALAMALLHFLWQGAIVGLLAWLLLGLLRGARPQLRYAVACIALAACAVLPAWHVIDTLLPASPAPSHGTRVAPLAHAALAAWGEALRPHVLSDDHSALPWVVALWATGCTLLSLRMALGLHWLRRQRASALPADDLRQARMDALAGRFGIARRVALRIVGDGDSPLTAGCLRPVVLLPAALAARLPVELLEALLAHELAHVRRHDYLVNLLQGAVEALLFYHPVVWWLSHRIRIERELVADDLAASTLGDPRRLAVALAELDRIATSRSPFPPPHFALAAHGGHLMPRIRQLIRPDRRNPGAVLLLPLLGLAVAGAGFYVHAQPAPARAAAAPAPASAPAQAAGPKPAAGARIARIGTGDGYALVREGEDGMRMSGDLGDVEAIRAASRSVGGDFLWFRRDGRAWIVRDADTLARAHAAWRPVEAFDREMRELGARMHPHSERMQELGEHMQSLQSQAVTETPEMRAASQRIEGLGGEIRQLAQQQVALAHRMLTADAGQAVQLRAEADALDARQQVLRQDIERQAATIEADARRIEASHAPMEALGREMEAAGRPMEAIGKEMEAVGAQIERVAAVSDAQVRKLLDEAYARGLATPAPGAQ